MMFDWDEYLRLARHLVQDGAAPSEEALQRCATSRAYYAAFWKARLARHDATLRVAARDSAGGEIVVSRHSHASDW